MKTPSLLHAGVAAALCVCCSPAAEGPDDGVVIGLLLPYTGNASATASNLERAVIYAVDRINEGGGVKGRPLRLVARDTHSDVARAHRSAEQLIDAGAAVVIGPESPEIADDIRPLLGEHGIVFLSPLVGAATDPSSTCSAPWFRLAPSARSLGEALAKQLSEAGVESTAVLYAASAYDESLRDAVEQRFVSLGGTIATEVRLDPNAQSYESVVGRVAGKVDAALLASSPRTAALTVNEFDAVGIQLSWFLSPQLKTDLLLANVPPDALEGALGVAPKIYDTSETYPEAFSRRWQGDQPLEGAFFYYDAVGLFAFGYENAVAENGEVSFESLVAGIIDAAAPPGQAAGWDELEEGLARLRAGEDIYYSGLTGPLLFEKCGARRIGVTSPFRVRDGKIAD